MATKFADRHKMPNLVYSHCIKQCVCEIWRQCVLPVSSYGHFSGKMTYQTSIPKTIQHWLLQQCQKLSTWSMGLSKRSAPEGLNHVNCLIISLTN